MLYIYIGFSYVRDGKYFFKLSRTERLGAFYFEVHRW